MYRPIKYIAASSGNVLSDGSAVPAVILGASGSYSFESPGGVTFELTVGADAAPYLLEVTVKGVTGSKVTLLSQ